MSDRFERFESLPEDRRRAVVDAAAEVFGDEDYARASTADIARRAGVSKSQLFFYFRNKRELYLYVLTALTRRVADAVVDERWMRSTTSSRSCATPRRRRPDSWGRARAS